MLKIKEAQEELAKNSYRDIQEQTAWKWASRAGASYQNVLTVDEKKKFQTFLLAQEYEHEAIEHAALVETGATSLLSRVQTALNTHSTQAWEELERVFGL